MNSANHILSKEGILTSFSISKKISAKQVKLLRDKIKSADTDKTKLQELLTKAIIEETKKSLESKEIPGLILPGSNCSEEEKKRIMELTYFSSIVSKKITDKKINKYHACYIINAIVNMLGLSEEDFDEFHRKFSKYKDGSSDDEEQSE